MGALMHISRRCLVAAAVCAAVVVSVAALAQSPTFSGFTPGNLVVSRSVYTGDASTVKVGQALPPNCPVTASCGSATATNDGTYPGVWGNDKADAAFGVTTPIFLDQMTPSGSLINTLAVPTSAVVTSFSSKSELALNLSADRSAITFMRYVAPVNALDISNSNTPGVIDPTNPVGASAYRAVVQVGADGKIQVTDTNAYSGNNGRAAMLANGFYYTVGNDNNGSGTPDNIVNSTGVEIATPGQSPSTVPQMIGSFSIAQLTNPATGQPYTADKAGKDSNYRGLTIFNNTLYVTKGSGSNGVNTVYQVGTAGKLPTLTDAATTPINILPGFNTLLARDTISTAYPFGIWFANANTLYVADEGDGTAANAGTSTTSGLQKWILREGTWRVAYVMQNGLGLGVSYGVTGYPAALNPMTDGLRNITGRVNADGTVTIWGLTSTVSTNGDQGADPNKLVMITDVLANTDPGKASTETFTVLKTAGFGEVLRGVTFTPGTVPVLQITTGSLPAPKAGTAYSQTLSATGGVAPYTWTVSSGTLPVGLTLSSAGVLSGTPSVGGTSTFTILVTDSANNKASQTYTLTVAGSGCTLSSGGQGFTAAGGTATVTISGTCPASQVAGLPSWITATTGTGSVTLQVAANTGASRSTTLTIAFNLFTVEQAAAAGLVTFTSSATIPEIASGGSYTTTLTLVNTGSTPATVRVNFFGNNGVPLALPLSAPSISTATLDRTIAPAAELVLTTSGPEIQAALQGWAQVLSTGGVSATALIHENTGSTALEGILTGDSRTSSAYLLPFDNNDRASTMVLLVNTSSSVASVAVTIRDDAGNLLQSSSIFGGTLPLLPPMGHAQFDLTTMFPVTAARRGTIEFDAPSGGGITVAGIRATASGAASVIPSLSR